MKKYVFMFLLSLTSMVSMARDSIVTALVGIITGSWKLKEEPPLSSALL